MARPFALAAALVLAAVLPAPATAQAGAADTRSLPAERDTIVAIGAWGTSGVQRFLRTHEAVFTDALETLTGARVEVFNFARGATKLIPQADAEDWSPRSRELYQRALAGSRRSFSALQDENPDAVVIPLGIVWALGNDQVNIMRGLNTVDEFMDELVLFLDAIQRDLPGVPLYMFGPSIPHTSAYETGAEFAQRERETCEAHPICTYVMNPAEIAWRGYHTCTSNACRRRYYEDETHLGNVPSTIIGLELARSLARDFRRRE